MAVRLERKPPQGLTGKGNRAGGGKTYHKSRFTDHCGHQPGPGKENGRREIQKRFLLPAEYISHFSTAVKRSPGGYSPAGFPLYSTVCQKSRKKYQSP